LACVAGYTEMVCPLEDGHPSQYQPTDSAEVLVVSHNLTPCKCI